MSIFNENKIYVEGIAQKFKLFLYAFISLPTTKISLFNLSYKCENKKGHTFT